jgi:hypothetical protein
MIYRTHSMTYKTPESKRMKSLEWRKKNPNYGKEWKKKNPDYDKNYKREWNLLHPEHQKEYHKRRLWVDARRRAKKKGIEFSITVDDIPDIPDVCPVLNIPIKIGNGRQCANSPTLDRTNNDIGYTAGNLNIISWRANSLKNNGTIKEFCAIVDYMGIHFTLSEAQVLSGCHRFLYRRVLEQLDKNPKHWPYCRREVRNYKKCII